jgi:hypothetical protein
MLERAGYAVDYYPGEQVTVDFYRDLPKRDYDLLIMRTHAARYEAEGTRTDVVDLFTSEPYSTEEHVDEQLAGRLRIGIYNPDDPEGSPQYFSITADFVRSSMGGGFDGASVILMGCDVLRGEALAQAFVEKGADTVIGWDQSVSASHTDAATQRLLEHLLMDGHSAEDAVIQTMAEVGPDPAYGSKFLVYPPHR